MLHEFPDVVWPVGQVEGHFVSIVSTFSFPLSMGQVVLNARDGKRLNPVQARALSALLVAASEAIERAKEK